MRTRMLTACRRRRARSGPTPALLQDARSREGQRPQLGKPFAHGRVQARVGELDRLPKMPAGPGRTNPPHLVHERFAFARLPFMLEQIVDRTDQSKVLRDPTEPMVDVS